MRKQANTLGVTERTYRWYLWLLKSANYTGYVCRSQASLMRDLEISKKSLSDFLSELETAKLIEIKSPLPFLVLKLTLWSAKYRKVRGKKADSVQVSCMFPAADALLPLNKYPSAAAANKRNSGEGVQGKGNLADRVAVATGWTDAAEVQHILSLHSPPIIEKALARLAQVPNSQIRTSRIALFRYLLNRFSSTNHAHESPTNHHPA